MYTSYLRKIDPFSSFKFGLFLGVVISIIFLSILILLMLFNIIVAAFGPAIFANVLIAQVIQLFFSIITLLLFSLFLGCIFAFIAFVYNLSLKWIGGIKLEITEYTGNEENEESQNTQQISPDIENK